MASMHIQTVNHSVHASYEYDKEGREYRFTSDIQLGKWTIAKTIGIGGPRESRYKYDFSNYLIFTITDRDGISRIWNFYHNCNDEMMNVTKTYPDNVAERGIRLFLENHPIFNSFDWKEFDAMVQLSEIKKVMESDLNTLTKVCEIRRILG